MGIGLVVGLGQAVGTGLFVGSPALEDGDTKNNGFDPGIRCTAVDDVGTRGLSTGARTYLSGLRSSRACLSGLRSS